MTAGNPLRERYREQVREDVKAAGLRQLAAGGAQALSVNAIAKELGVSGPALYRYFAGRDELLAALILDAYADLTAALAAAVGRARKPGTRLRALIAAWRAWATGEPHRYALLFRPPLPGYDAHREEFAAAARETMAVLLAVLAPLPVRDEAADARAVASHAELLATTGASPAHLRLALRLWARFHGLVDLENGGNFAAMGVDPAPLYEAELASALA